MNGGAAHGNHGNHGHRRDDEMNGGESNYEIVGYDADDNYAAF